MRPQGGEKPQRATIPGGMTSTPLGGIEGGAKRTSSSPTSSPSKGGMSPMVKRFLIAMGSTVVGSGGIAWFKFFS